MFIETKNDATRLQMELLSILDYFPHLLRFILQFALVKNLFLDNLYSERPPMEDFLAWRDLRVMDEVHWYGWFIDYWMEAGLLRDIFTHKITTQEHWNLLMMPTVYPKSSVTYEKIVGGQVVTPTMYDPHRINDVSGGCEPVAVISAEKLADYNEGPDETRKIAQV